MNPDEFLSFLRPTLRNGLMITDRQLALLALCAAIGDPIRVKQAAIALTISRPAFAGFADKLENKQFIKRNREDLEHRQVGVRITPQGNRIP